MLALTPAPPANNLASDAEFDSVYDKDIRDLSAQHWTPVRVAIRAAQILTRAGARRILDVGSGVGKFCIAGALSTPATYVGLERRGRLVEIARSAAARYGAERATFVHGSLDDFSFEGFSGIYLFNPFYEQVSDLIVQIDETIERSPITYEHFLHTTATKLEKLEPRVAVVTYNGFGGHMPLLYTFVGEEPAGTDRLELWIKL
jgi:predicted O-methyltransferase YrrM